MAVRSFSDLVALSGAAVASTIALITLDYFLLPEQQIPRSIILMDCALTILILGGTRSTWRFVREHVQPSLRGDTRRRAFLVGAESGGQRIVEELNRSRRLNYRIVGFLDDNTGRLGSSLAGVPFLGAVADVLKFSQKYRVGHVLVISGTLGGDHLRHLVETCRAAQIEVKVIPSVDEMLAGRFQMRIREVNINDLLGREPIVLEDQVVTEMIRGRRVMVTGAGGSIGSEICRQVAARGPAELVLVEQAENSLFRIEQELLAAAPVELAACVADICDASRMEALFVEHRPDIVFHAAAHKHVPLMERNPGQAVANNVFGTKTVADLALRHQAERFVLISTDKAVEPTSVMGATKQLAERYVHALEQRTRTTRFVAVRFGNVLASDGSVVPTFQEQIRRGGPVTITHARMERFFMTIPEASQLVLHAAAIGRGGEVFVLDMGRPVKILDLARDMIRLSGHATDEIEIRVVGLRPGEKLYERLHADHERMLPTEHPRIHACYTPCFPLEEVETTLHALREAIHVSPAATIAAIERAVPDFHREHSLEMQLAPDSDREREDVGAAPLRGAELQAAAAG